MKRVRCVAFPNIIYHGAHLALLVQPLVPKGAFNILEVGIGEDGRGEKAIRIRSKKTKWFFKGCGWA